MKTKVWLNLDPQKVDVNYLYKKFEEMGCDFEAEAIPDNDPELLVKKAQNVDIVVATMEPWNETTLGAVKGKVKFIQKYGTGVDSVDLKAAGKNGIPVANIPGANAPAVAEVAMMHILNLGRRFTPCVEGCRKSATLCLGVSCRSCCGCAGCCATATSGQACQHRCCCHGCRCFFEDFLHFDSSQHVF